MITRVPTPEDLAIDAVAARARDGEFCVVVVAAPFMAVMVRVPVWAERDAIGRAVRRGAEVCRPLALPDETIAGIPVEEALPSEIDEFMLLATAGG